MFLRKTVFHLPQTKKCWHCTGSTVRRDDRRSHFYQRSHKPLAGMRCVTEHTAVNTKPVLLTALSDESSLHGLVAPPSRPPACCWRTSEKTFLWALQNSQISTQDRSREPWSIQQWPAIVSTTIASITTPSTPTCLIKGHVKEAAVDMNPKRQRVPSDPDYSHKRWQSFGDVRISRARLWKRNPLCLLLRPPSSSFSL